MTQDPKIEIKGLKFTLSRLTLFHICGVGFLQVITGPKQYNVKEKNCRNMLHDQCMTNSMLYKYMCLCC